MEKEQEPQQNIPEIEVTDSISIGLESKVVLYNDDWHTFDDANEVDEEGYLIFAEAD